jgi:kinesin family protein 4/21/27
MESNIGVCVRCRPLLQDEIRGKRCLTIQNEVISIGEKKFIFDNVFDEPVEQIEIYDKCIKSLAEGCFNGYNATVFACSIII